MDPSLRPLHLVSPDEELHRFEGMVEAMAGTPRHEPTPRIGFPTLAEFGRLLAAVERLEQRVEVLEAELVPLHRSRKCPRCHQLSLVLVTSRRHPEFDAADIEQHDVRCGCGSRGSRHTTPATSCAELLAISSASCKPFGSPMSVDAPLNQPLSSTIGVCCERCSLKLSMATAMWSVSNRAGTSNSEIGALKASGKPDIGKLPYRWLRWTRIAVSKRALPQALCPPIASDLCDPSTSIASVGCIGVHVVPHIGS
jgi:hypothetical protein